MFNIVAILSSLKKSAQTKFVYKLHIANNGSGLGLYSYSINLKFTSEEEMVKIEHCAATCK